MSAANALPPEECANCGAAIPRTAKACPECGADEQTGWRERSVYDDLDLPESAWADESTPSTKRAPTPARVNGVPWYWWLVGAILLALMVGSVLGLR
jgi:RNA polymerase subunit RPABC4/transcription elongation factor Spt4